MIEQVVEDDPAASGIRLGGPQVLPGQDPQVAGQFGEEQKAEHLFGYARRHSRCPRRLRPRSTGRGPAQSTKVTVDRSRTSPSP